MTATVHPTPIGWARAHRALLVLAVLVVGLAAALAVTAARLAVGSPAAPVTSPPGSVLTATDAGCASAHPGAPC